MAASPTERIASATEVAHHPWWLDDPETPAQYVTRMQQVVGAAAAEVGVARHLVRLLRCRTRGHSIPHNPPGVTTLQELVFREAREAQSAPEIQNLLTQAETDLKKAIDDRNRAQKSLDLAIEERQLTLDEKKLQEHARSRVILASITGETRDINMICVAIPDRVSAALRAAYGTSTDEQVPCAVCGFKNGGHHAAAMTIDGVTRSPTVRRVQVFRVECEACGIPYDATNIIPLCGESEWKGTCHHLFDSDRLALVFKPRAGGWKCCTGDEHSALRGTVQFPNRPNARGMHARAMCCARNVMFTASDVADMRAPDDSMIEGGCSDARRGGDGRERCPASAGSGCVVGRKAARPRRDGRARTRRRRLCAALLARVPFAPPMVVDWAELDLSHALPPTQPSGEQDLVEAILKAARPDPAVNGESPAVPVDAKVLSEPLENRLSQHGLQNQEIFALLQLTIHRPSTPMVRRRALSFCSAFHPTIRSEIYALIMRHVAFADSGSD